ncbi:MAG: ATP-binding protein [Clostridium perfringens]|nr:ATP-binding protein [Clostridium perfringens]
MKKRKISFEKKIILTALLITFIPLLLSYVVFLQDKLTTIDTRIKQNLKNMAFYMSESDLVKTALNEKINDGAIQEYTKQFIKNDADIDIIVVGDMNGTKYSHLDETQIGEVYVNEDNKKVLKEGVGYYSLMEGSVGYTYRRFEPIYYDGTQIGFVMVGKYNNQIEIITKRTRISYTILFVISFSISIIIAKFFAKIIKSAILGMEPEEITTLYKQKRIIINSVKDGIIALNKNYEVTEINKNCYDLIEDFSIDAVLKKLDKYIKSKEDFEMREMIIQGEKVFVTINSIMEASNYYGVVITLTNRKNINKLAKEITGVDEVINNLRANVHEFKNNLHVILGLLQLKEYDEAINFIRRIQKIKEISTSRYLNIKDNYVRAMLMARDVVAKERDIEFILTDDSYLDLTHNYIDSYDIITILGNLIENAFEACEHCDAGKVEVALNEDSMSINIKVRDNGEKIKKEIINELFKEGKSTKGEGRGTGLYLVKNRVELYNGDIKIVESNNEKKFEITILKGE